MCRPMWLSSCGPAGNWAAARRWWDCGCVRACASRWSWAAAWAAVPAVVGPGAADQAATDDGGAGQRQPELDDQPPPFGAPAQLAVLVAPGVGALDHPPAARLDRRWHPAGGDLADHAARGQDLPARLVVIAGVQVHDWLGGQQTHRTDGVQGRREQPVVAV